MEAINRRWASVRSGPGQGPEGLRIVPILGPSHDEPTYRLLEDEVLGRVRIGEVSETGSVPTLRVENLLDDRLLLMDGQELVGAKQNRILNTDVLVPANATLDVPVSCVEQGRWGYTSRTFTPGRAASHRTRRGKARRVHESLKCAAGFDADQGAVWEEVEAELRTARVSSRTSALSDVYAARERELEELRRSLTLPDDAVGLAVFHGNEFQGLDLFDRRSTLVYFWRSLVDSYALGWLSGAAPHESSRTTTDALLEALFEQMRGAAWSVHGSPGEGTDARLEHEALVGSALVWDQQTVLHLAVFPKSEASDTERSAAERVRRPRLHRRYMRRRPE